MSNDCKESIADFSKVNGDTVEVNREIGVLWLNVIMAFRNQGCGHQGRHLPRQPSALALAKSSKPASLNETAGETPTAIYNAACQNIEEAVKRIERVATMAERQTHAMNEVAILQRLLSLEESKQEGVNLPCNNLPVAGNNRFFGRQHILQAIEEHLLPADTSSRLSSMALYGLGGIGKTQIALAYAYERLDDLDAVFWIAAQDSLSIQQSFSQVAVDTLKLPNAHPQAYQENMLLVLNWLQKTCKAEV